MAPVVETATLSDVPDLVDVWCNSMNNAFLLKAFPHTPGGLKWLADMWVMAVTGKQGEGKAQSTVVVVRNGEGRVVSALLFWKVPDGVSMGLDTWRERWPSYAEIPEMSDDLIAGFFNRMATQHEYVMGYKGHIFLEGLMTHKDHRKQGYASQLLGWTIRLADAMDLITYLDGGRSAVPLYKAHGFKEADLSAIGGANPKASIPMLRQPRSATCADTHP